MAAVTICSDFGAHKNKVSHCFPIYLPWNDGPDAMILVFWMLSFNFFTLLFHFHQDLGKENPCLETHALKGLTLALV